MPFELENAIGLATAGVIYLVSPFTSPPGILSFEEVRRIAHTRGVPVLVDVAPMVPPREHLFRYLRDGTSFPKETAAMIQQECSAVLLGALGDPRVPGLEHARDILFGLRCGLDLYMPEAAEGSETGATAARS